MEGGGSYKYLFSNRELLSPETCDCRQDSISLSLENEDRVFVGLSTG